MINLQLRLGHDSWLWGTMRKGTTMRRNIHDNKHLLRYFGVHRVGHQVYKNKALDDNIVEYQVYWGTLGDKYL